MQAYRDIYLNIPFKNHFYSLFGKPRTKNRILKNAIDPRKIGNSKKDAKGEKIAFVCKRNNYTHKDTRGIKKEKKEGESNRKTQTHAKCQYHSMLLNKACFYSLLDADETTSLPSFPYS